jgi:protein-disulfide isomerase
VPLLEQVLGQYPKEVKLVFKHFPLQMHALARPAAIAAMAAGAQGKFWEFHDRLFKNVSQLSDAKIQEIATELGLDQAKFDASRKDNGILALINRDMQEGQAIGVRGTPTIFINGRQLKNRSIQGFQELIGEELRKKDKTGK